MRTKTIILSDDTVATLQTALWCAGLVESAIDEHEATYLIGILKSSVSVTVEYRDEGVEPA